MIRSNFTNKSSFICPERIFGEGCDLAEITIVGGPSNTKCIVRLFEVKRCNLNIRDIERARAQFENTERILQRLFREVKILQRILIHDDLHGCKRTVEAVKLLKKYGIHIESLRKGNPEIRRIFNTYNQLCLRK